VFFAFVCSFLLFSRVTVEGQQPVHLTTAGVFLFSNSYIVSDGTNVILIDLGIDQTHAITLENLIRIGFPNTTVRTIFITHGHPDHYSGLAYLPSSFNSVPVYVANEQVKRELLANLKADNYGIGGGLPINVTTYPYASRVQVLPVPGVLQGLARNLSVITSFKPAETHSSGLVYDSVQNLLYTGDLIFRNRHGFFGPTLSVNRVQKWIDDISILVKTFSNGTTAYPGHGPFPLSSIEEAFQFQFYLKRFLGLVNSCVPPANLPSQMIHLFPRLNSSDFVLQFLLINPAWANYQSVACDTTNSTRAVLCGNLSERAACLQARPLCDWRRATVTSHARRPIPRPKVGSCLPSSRPLKPSQPFGP